MKSLLPILILLLSMAPVLAQEEQKETRPMHKNEVKFQLTDVINGRYTVGYERAVGRHIGVALSVGNKTKDGLLKISGLDSEFFKTNDLTYSGFRIVPEVKYYLNEHTQGMLSGFYFGAYITYVNLKSEFKGIYMNEDGDFPFHYDVNIRTNSLGFMVGYKLPVSKRFYIDFMIAGPGAGNYRFEFKEIVAAPDEFWIDLNDELELISIFDLINADFEFSSSNTSDSLILPSFRYGITLGYSF
ncbi:DUF3575 domain-containing protein [Cognatitamlana onchidii]|uniref:DUF3575 domain-containing protein n=1 Tax=Cognatitamlana onchidii TaxID=2562860 RepID=UPI0010A66550|nr:DUF3575 domain-containing protein [Algibacter onchidii]